jgi:hypothetical protein
MANNNYSLSFTTGAALLSETIAVAHLWQELGDWAEVKAVVLAQNTLQARTESTLKKLYGEISRRLKNLNDEELTSLATGNDEEQKHIIWLAICRHYAFIHDFAMEVIYEHFDRGRYPLMLDDYDAFFNAKAEWHSNLDSISSQTKSKARQVVFKMLRECGVLNDQKEIVAQNLSDRLKDLIQNKEIEQIRLFPGVGS